MLPVFHPFINSEVKHMSYYKYGRETEFDDFSSKNLQRKAIAYDRNDVGKLKISSNESLRHFVAKSVLVYELLKMKHRVYCKRTCQASVVSMFSTNP